MEQKRLKHGQLALVAEMLGISKQNANWRIKARKPDALEALKYIEGKLKQMAEKRVTLEKHTSYTVSIK